MQYLPNLIFIYLVLVGAMVSPGPDFLIVLRNSLGHSARAGIFTASGIALGNAFHMSYCLAGIGLLISHSLILFSVIKGVGALYLIYIGIGALRSRGVKAEEMGTGASPAKSGRKAFANGLITNIFNPKCTLFFLALFSQMIDPKTPIFIQLVFCALCMVTAFCWFSLVALVMGVPAMRRRYARASRWLDRVFGGFFIALGARLALSRL